MKLRHDQYKLSERDNRLFGETAAGSTRKQREYGSGSHRPDLKVGGKWLVYHHRLVEDIDCRLVQLARRCQSQSPAVTFLRNYEDEECYYTRILSTTPFDGQVLASFNTGT